MPVHFHIEPGVSMSWDDFRIRKPPFSVAVDGYCSHRPDYDPRGPYRNFDHHTGVSRDDTLCACAQVRVASQKGLSHAFRAGGGRLIHAWANDCDSDVGMCFFLLRHPRIAEVLSCHRIDDIIGLIHKLDTSGGLWPFGDDELPDIEVLSWIFDPYWQLRMSGQLDERNPIDYIRVLKACEVRIRAYLDHRHESVPLEDAYEIIGGGESWVMVREIGAHARIKMARDGIRAFVSVRQRPSGRWVYTGFRFSEYHFHPPAEIANFFNEREKPGNKFGGGNLVFANAYGHGSTMGPNELARRLNELIESDFTSTIPALTTVDEDLPAAEEIGTYVDEP